MTKWSNNRAFYLIYYPPISTSKKHKRYCRWLQKLQMCKLSQSHRIRWFERIPTNFDCFRSLQIWTKNSIFDRENLTGLKLNSSIGIRTGRIYSYFMRLQHGLVHPTPTPKIAIISSLRFASQHCTYYLLSSLLSDFYQNLIKLRSDVLYRHISCDRCHFDGWGLKMEKEST